MNRRDFALSLAAAAAVSPWPVLAAGQPVEGQDFIKLGNPVPVAVPGKGEVIEFFGYWCPHCASLEPTLEPWVRKLPASVNFRRFPVAWNPAHEPYQKLFYGLEALGIGGDIHKKVFAAVHQQGMRMENDAAVAAFCSANGIDKAKLVDAMKSFSVASKANVAVQAFKSFGLDGVPSFVVNGRFITSPEKAKGDARALEVIEYLLRK